MADHAREEKQELVDPIALRVQEANNRSIEQMTDIYGVPCDVQHVRTFRNKREMGVGYPLREVGTWFVYDRDSATDRWHMHCGPFSSFEQGADWIKGIRDRRDL